ncbi:MAG: Exocyst complex component 4 [Marteilia pararefringens]
MDRLITSSLTSLMTSNSERDRVNNKQKIEEAYKKSCYSKNKAFKSCERDIRNLSLLVLKIKENIETNLGRIKSLKNELSICKRLLFVRKEEVSIAWEKKIESDALYSMVKRASKSHNGLKEIQKCMSEGNFLMAANLLYELQLGMQTDNNLKVVVEILASKVSKLSANIIEKLKESLLHHIYKKILPDIGDIIELSRPSFLNFDASKEANSFEYINHSPNMNFWNDMKKELPKIFVALSNLSAFEQNVSDIIQNMEIDIVENLIILTNKIYETLKFNTPISIQTNSELFSNMCLFFTYRALLLYCSNVLSILSKFISLAVTHKRSVLDSTATTKLVYDKIQNIVIKLIGNILQISENDNNEIVLDIMKSVINLRESDNKDRMVDYENEALVFAMIVDNPKPSKHFIVESLDLKLSYLDDKAEIEVNTNIPKSGQDKILSKHLNNIASLPAFNQSNANSINNLPYIYKTTYSFMLFLEKSFTCPGNVNDKIILRQYIGHIVTSIFFNKYIVEIVDNNLKNINNKLSNFETIDVVCESSQLSNSQKQKEQFEILGIGNEFSQSNKKVVVAVHDVLETAKLLIQNVSFLEVDWSHSSQIFDHLTKLLNEFQQSLSDRVSHLFSISIKELSQDAGVKHTNIALSANLVMDQSRFKSFYENFGLLIDYNENFDSTMNLSDWFQAEHELLKRLKKFSIKYLINLTTYQRIGILADSLFWFVRNFSKNLSDNYQVVQNTTMQHCREILTLSARLMLALRIEVKLRIILFFDPSKRIESNYKETLGSIGSILCSVYDEVPEDVQKIVFWGFGSFIRINFLEKLADRTFYPTISSLALDNIVDDLLQLKIIWYKLEPKLIAEFDKLIFFCEFYKKSMRYPNKIVTHATKIKKFTYHEYRIMLDGSHRTFCTDLSDNVKQAQLDDLLKTFQE